MTDQHLDLTRPDAPRATTGLGPLTPVRTSDVHARRAWEESQKAATTPSAIDLHWAGVEERRKAQLARWKKEDEERQSAIQRWEQHKQQHNERVLAERAARQKADSDGVTKRVLLASLWERHGATPEEIRRVTALVERNSPQSVNEIALYEVTLLQLRAVLG